MKQTYKGKLIDVEDNESRYFASFYRATEKEAK